jgi:hypothetical protein
MAWNERSFWTCPRCGGAYPMATSLCPHCEQHIGADDLAEAEAREAQTQADARLDGAASSGTERISRTTPDPGFSGAMCPICQEGVLAQRWVQAYPGANKMQDFVCQKCGSEFYDGTGVLASLELVDTRRPDLPRWEAYAHQSLSIPVWKDIAVAGPSSQGYGDEGERAKAEPPQEANAEVTPPRAMAVAVPLASMAQPTPQAVQPTPEVDAPILLRSCESVVFCLGVRYPEGCTAVPVSMLAQSPFARARFKPRVMTNYARSTEARLS